MIRSRSILAQRRPQPLSACMLAALTALSAVSCSPGVDPPEVRLNPSPQQRYEITLTIEDPPASVEVRGQVQFFITNTDCMPFVDRIAGIKPDSTFRVPLMFEQETATTFVGHFFADALLPENYYGLGECHWNFTSAKAFIETQGIEQSADIPHDLVVAQGTQINLCRRPDSGGTVNLCFRMDRKPAAQVMEQLYMVSIEASKD